VSERRGRPSEKKLFKNCAISTSGATFQYVDIEGKRYSHIVDPRTGIGLTESYLVTIIAPDGLSSDPLSKVASVLGPESEGMIVRAYPKVKVRFGYGAVE
jgi:thiamine biosynthesis lipoprotein